MTDATTDLAPEVTDFFTVARANGATKWADDADSKGLLDVLLDYIADVHVAALLSLEDIHNLTYDLYGVALFLIKEANAASQRLYDAEELIESIDDRPASGDRE